MRCYVCFNTMQSDENRRVRALFDRLDNAFFDTDEEPLTALDARLGLVHCQGDADQFDPDGTVRVCQSCFDEGVAAVGIDIDALYSQNGPE